jgi:hypothetical protein
MQEPKNIRPEDILKHLVEVLSFLEAEAQKERKAFQVIENENTRMVVCLN